MNDHPAVGRWIHAAKRHPVVAFTRGLFFTGASVRKAEPDVWAFIRRTVRLGWRCVDVGANRGEFSALMAREAGRSGAVWAFELHPENVRRLRANLWRFGGRITIVHAAVSDGQAASVAVYPGRNRSGAEWTIVGRAGGPGVPEFSVPAVALDRHFNAGVGLNLVKIDVEGAGGSVLAGMRRIASEFRPVIVMELHNATEWEALQSLGALGYLLQDPAGRALSGSPRFVCHAVAVPARDPSVGEQLGQ